MWSEDLRTLSCVINTKFAKNNDNKCCGFFYLVSFL